MNVLIPLLIVTALVGVNAIIWGWFHRVFVQGRR